MTVTFSSLPSLALRLLLLLQALLLLPVYATAGAILTHGGMTARYVMPCLLGAAMGALSIYCHDAANVADRRQVELATYHLLAKLPTIAASRSAP